MKKNQLSNLAALCFALSTASHAAVNVTIPACDNCAAAAVSDGFGCTGYTDGLLNDLTSRTNYGSSKARVDGGSIAHGFLSRDNSMYNYEYIGENNAGLYITHGLEEFVQSTSPASDGIPNEFIDGMKLDLGHSSDALEVYLSVEGDVYVRQTNARTAATPPLLALGIDAADGVLDVNQKYWQPNDGLLDSNGDDLKFDHLLYGLHGSQPTIFAVAKDEKIYSWGGGLYNGRSQTSNEDLATPMIATHYQDILDRNGTTIATKNNGDSEHHTFYVTTSSASRAVMLGKDGAVYVASGTIGNNYKATHPDRNFVALIGWNGANIKFFLADDGQAYSYDNSISGLNPLATAAASEDQPLLYNRLAYGTTLRACEQIETSLVYNLLCIEQGTNDLYVGDTNMTVVNGMPKVKRFVGLMSSIGGVLVETVDNQIVAVVDNAGQIVTDVRVNGGVSRDVDGSLRPSLGGVTPFYDWSLAYDCIATE